MRNSNTKKNQRRGKKHRRILTSEVVEARWCLSTIGFATHDIFNLDANNSNNAIDVKTADIDLDGDLDVLSAMEHDHDNGEIAWYENTDGKGNLGLPQVISADRAFSVYAGDLDGDGDLDVLSASYSFFGVSRIRWHENVDGKGTFGEQKVIVTLGGIAESGDAGLDAAILKSVDVADLDGDGDLDVLFASFYGSENIGWYENTDGRGTFSKREPFTTDDVGVSVSTGDLDGDGDLDVVLADYGGIAWHENTDGQARFDARNNIATTDDVQFVYAFDLDGDGDLDVLSASDNKIAWHENTDGLGAFGDERLITTQVDHVQSVDAADVDGDGDVDVLSASDTKIAWYENTGDAAFGSQQIITTNRDRARSVYATDLDVDGDLDVLSAFDTKIAWHENRPVGDSNDDGVFDSRDLIAVFQAGEYEDDTPGNSTFDEGDWNGDGEFDTADFIVAFQCGTFVAAAVENVFELGDGLLADIAAANQETRNVLIPESDSHIFGATLVK